MTEMVIVRLLMLFIQNSLMTAPASPVGMTRKIHETRQARLQQC